MGNDIPLVGVYINDTTETIIPTTFWDLLMAIKTCSELPNPKRRGYDVSYSQIAELMTTPANSYEKGTISGYMQVLRLDVSYEKKKEQN